MDLTRTEPESNLCRLYRMPTERGRFGDWGLISEWGRMGTGGRSRTDWFESEADTKNARFDLQMQKSKRGCSGTYHYFR